MFICRIVPLLAAFASAAGAPEAAPSVRGREDDELHPRHAGPGAAEFGKFGTALAAAVSKATEEAEPPELKATNMDDENLLIPRATQSSTLHGGVAARAIDGNRDGDYNNGSVTHTEREANAWWEVDLRTTSPISAIKVYNRVDCCLDRIVGARVEILDADGNPVTGGTRTIEDAQDRYEFHFESVRGRYVKISKQGPRAITTISLAEVGVYGPAGGCPEAGAQFSYIGAGLCLNSSGRVYPSVMVNQGDCDYAVHSAESCAGYCRSLPTDGAPTLRGFELATYPDWSACYCYYDGILDASFLGGACTSHVLRAGRATGPIASANDAAGRECYAFNN